MTLFTPHEELASETEQNPLVPICQLQPLLDPESIKVQQQN